jgi:hypothetical protein
MFGAEEAAARDLRLCEGVTTGQRDSRSLFDLGIRLKDDPTPPRKVVTPKAAKKPYM